MLNADWYERVAKQRYRMAFTFKVVTFGFSASALSALVAMPLGYQASRCVPAFLWSVFGAVYAWVHVGSITDQALRYERDAKEAPARNEQKRRMNEHYQMMNYRYGHHYEKIDDGWWSEDPALLVQYAGLVSRWKPSGDLHESAT